MDEVHAQLTHDVRVGPLEVPTWQLLSELHQPHTLLGSAVHPPHEKTVSQ